MSKIQINNEVRDMTAEEQAQFDADASRWITNETNAIAEKEAKEDLKASAKAKLINGEPLTEEEADTIVL